MKSKAYRYILILILIGYIGYVIIYSGYSRSAPVEYEGMILQKTWWTTSWQKLLGLVVLIIAIVIELIVSKKKNRRLERRT